MDRLTMDGKIFVVVPVEEYRRLKTLAEMPLYPEADVDGRMPAVPAARAAIARSIIAQRAKLGMSQAQLAAAAKISVQVLNRIERAHVTADTATMVKIDRVLKNVGREAGKDRKRPMSVAKKT